MSNINNKNTIYEINKAIEEEEIIFVRDNLNDDYEDEYTIAVYFKQAYDDLDNETKSMLRIVDENNTELGDIASCLNEDYLLNLDDEEKIRWDENGYYVLQAVKDGYVLNINNFNF